MHRNPPQKKGTSININAACFAGQIKYRGAIMKDLITISELFSILLKRVKVLVFTSLLIGAAVFAVSYFLIPPTYTSEVLLYVNNISTNQQSQGVNINDINASQQLVNTYAVILNSDPFVTSVIQAENLSITPEKLKKNVILGAVNGTEILSIKVENSNSQVACNIANRYAEMAVPEIERIVTGGSVKLIANAKAADKPTSPQVKLNTIIGIMMGLIGACIVVLLVNLFDANVKGEEDLTEHYNIPILGIVPNANANNRLDCSEYAQA